MQARSGCPGRAFVDKEARYCAEIEDFDFTGAEPG
ncbi:hypothetical protein J2W51_005897 [Tardiphaga robiniae]|jgi:hypothetical protein|nr:hypothetical protein [Tardiphaga robiniae]